MRKVIWLLILAIITTSCKGVSEIEVSNKNNIEEIKETSIEELKDRMIFGMAKRDDYHIELVMLEGSHIIDNTIGADDYTGEYWKGKCQLELKKKDEMIDSLDVNDIFEELLTFKETFIIETFDEQDITYFLIGQYFSSNLNDYRLFKIVEDKLIYCEEVGSINISGKYKYSCVIENIGDGRYKYQFYDNSIDKVANRILVFEEARVRRDMNRIEY